MFTLIVIKKWFCLLLASYKEGGLNPEDTAPWPKTPSLPQKRRHPRQQHLPQSSQVTTHMQASAVHSRFSNEVLCFPTVGVGTFPQPRGDKFYKWWLWHKYASVMMPSDNGVNWQHIWLNPNLRIWTGSHTSVHHIRCESHLRAGESCRCCFLLNSKMLLSAADVDWCECLRSLNDNLHFKKMLQFLKMWQCGHLGGNFHVFFIIELMRLTLSEFWVYI